jgi:hypothetical protein
VKRLYLIEYLHARLREAAPARLDCGQLVEVIQAGCEGSAVLRRAASLPAGCTNRIATVLAPEWYRSNKVARARRILQRVPGAGITRLSQSWDVNR